MRLYLVQHGEAASESESPKRPLTEDGKAAVMKSARFIRQDGVEVDRIWHSTKLRAVQTAEIFAGELQIRELCEKREGIHPNDPVEPIAKEINALRPEDEIEDLMIVGHLPFLQKLASTLLSGDSSHEWVRFRQGGIVCLERENHGPWQLTWAVVPDLLKT
ncbi:MAG TPA: phosphohistidine phosphatase SixA [bacterium]|nr:phosphohistidine phosphatase SixA [bacterium]